jgi:hypothetical protein
VPARSQARSPSPKAPRRVHPNASRWAFALLVGGLLPSSALAPGCCLHGTKSDAEARDRDLAPFVDDPHWAPASPDAPPLARFGDSVELLAVDLPNPQLFPAVPGGSITVTMRWRVTQRLIGGWSLFTHLVDDRGERLANGDHAGPLRTPLPASGSNLQRLGPSMWLPGHVYTDTIRLSIPDTVAPSSELRVLVGIFRGEERLPVNEPRSPVRADGERRAEVARLTVVAPPRGSHGELRQLPPSAPPVPDLPVKKLGRGETPPVIDGRGDDAAWRDAPSTGAFVNVRTGAAAPGVDPQGEARLRWDDANLYALLTITSRHLEGGFAEGSVDPHLWEHECVELMLDPDGEGDNRDYYEVQVSPQGLVFDSRFDEENLPRGGPDGPFGHQAWSVGEAVRVTVAGTIDDDTDADTGYTVELRIPFSRFTHGAEPPTVGSSWRANFYAMKHNGGVAWSPILGLGNFHHAARFGRLHFVDADQAK